MNTPIVDFVKKYADSNNVRLHMPGHKGNSVLGCEKFDITEIDGADVLYSADGIIAQSQNNAAALFGTKSTHYSTEGSSLCIRAMLYMIKSYALQNGSRPIIAAGRNTHKTFVTAAALLNVDVDWLMPDTVQTVISCNINAIFLDKYLQSVKEKPTAIYITSPDYLGCVSDIKRLSNVCRKHNVLLVVDNAHGAYLKFLSNDMHPISLGADMCCDSAHKTLPVLTGGAYLHIANSAPEHFRENAQKALSIFASTSPSYLTLQSLDMANRYISDGYAESLSQCVKSVDIIKSELEKCGYTLCGDEPLKITLLTKSYGYTGRELSNILSEQNIVCEFSDPDYIVFMITPQISAENLEKLKTALCNIKKKDAVTSLPPVPTVKKAVMSLADAICVKTERLKITDCIGKVSAEVDVACPPAIPIVLPGELIDDRATKCFEYYGITEWSVLK